MESFWVHTHPHFPRAMLNTLRPEDASQDAQYPKTQTSPAPHNTGKVAPYLLQTNLTLLGFLVAWL